MASRVALIATVGVGVFAAIFAIAARLRHDRPELPAMSVGAVSTVSCPPDLIGAFGGPRGRTAWESHSQILRMMREPDLACGPSDADETYRLIWVHSFTVRSPLMVRVARKGHRVALRAARFAWDRETNELTTVTDVTRELEAADWSEFLGRVERHGFWAFPGRFDTQIDDGSTWLLEGRRGDAYHSASRRSPDNGAFRYLAMELVWLGQFDDPEPRAR